MPKLLAKYSRPTSACTDQVQKIPLTPLAEYHKYLAICDEIQQREKTDADDDDNGMDCLYFWPVMLSLETVPRLEAFFLKSWSWSWQ